MNTRNIYFVLVFYLSTLLVLLTAPCFASITGTVTDTVGSPVEGALVTFTDESNPDNYYNDYTDSDGRYEITLPVPVRVEDETPLSFRLFQNYPNPFNPATTIPYSLENPGHVTLSIYNIMGQKIRTLIDSYQSSGVHTVTWDGLGTNGKSAAAGLYIYRLKSGNKVKSRKMLLLDGSDNSASGVSAKISSYGSSVAKSTINAESTTYTLTITCEGIIPYVLDGIEITEGHTYDYVVPREDDEIHLALFEDKDEPLAALISTSEGESFGLIADKSSDGVIDKITGSVYVAEDSSSITFWYGDGGLPAVAEANGWIIKFSNYSDNTVDISFSSPDGEAVQVDAVELDAEKLAALRQFISEVSAEKIANWIFNDYVAGAIKGASLGAKIVSCAAAVGATIGSAGTSSAITIPVAAISCGSMFVSAVELVSWAANDEGVSGVAVEYSKSGSTAITSFKFTQSVIELKPDMVTSGIGLAFSIVDVVYENARENYENAPKTYAVMGQILKGGSGLSGVLVHIENGLIDETVTTNDWGVYSLSILPDGTYTITPSKYGYTFNPSSVTVTMSGADARVDDLIATPIFPPNTPGAPSGPSDGKTGTSYTFTASTTDPDGDNVAYKFDWGDGNYSTWTSYVSNGSSASKSYSYSSDGTYTVKVKAKDSYGNESGWSSGHSITISKTNSAPRTPSNPDGSSSGKINTSYNFTASTTDPDGDNVAYKFDWGDGNYSTWTSYVSSGSSASKSHSYSSTGTYYVKVKAKDSKGNESGWSSVSYIKIIDGTPDTTDITFVSIPGGSFRMGDIQNYNQFDREKPVHDVTVSGFEMSIYEITQGQYEAIIGSNPSYSIGDNKPVERVNWYDAVKFCNKLSEQMGYEKCYNESTWECDFSKNGFRLPTEAEWEYACRAGTETYFYIGNNLSSDGKTSTDLDKAGWYRSNSSSKTHPSGQKEPNAFGLYDMHGNVWDWCNDWYGEDYYSNSPSTNPAGPTSGSGRVLRGGGCLNDAWSCRSANRNGYYPTDPYYFFGFRVVRRP